MTTQKRPRRQRKGDRLISPGATKSEVAVDHAIAPFDRIARNAERQWGVDRLPELVAPELAAKYGAAIAYLNEAISEDDPDKAAAAAQNCIRGIEAMDAAARAAGHQPPECLAHVSVDGFAFRLVAEAGDHAAMPDDGLPCFSLREAALALRAYVRAAPIEEVKKHFPGAEIKSLPEPVSKSFWDAGGDPIPF